MYSTTRSAGMTALARLICVLATACGGGGDGCSASGGKILDGLNDVRLRAPTTSVWR